VGRGPDFIIIGAMKCATSTLYQQLAGQVGVFMASPKEPNFFSDDDEYQRGIDWYLGLFGAAAAGDLCGEASTHYAKQPTHPLAPKRMRSHLQDVKLIYVMRHPVERLVSHYIHEWTQRAIDVDLEEAVERHSELVQYGLYSQQLRPYLEAYGSDRILPVFLERLAAHPQDEFERICRFIGYPGRPNWNAGMGSKNVSSERLRTSRLRDFLVNTPLLRTLRRRLVPRSTRDRIKRLWTLPERPALSEAASARVAGLFDEDLAVLGSWLGVPLRCESFRGVVEAQPLQWSRRWP
jgi:hypothetical protein